MADFSASLGGTAVTIVAADTYLSGVPLTQVMAKGWRSGKPRVVAVDYNDVRTLDGQLVITAASKDAMITAIHALNAKLLAGTTLALQSKNETATVTFTVLPSQPMNPDLASSSFDQLLTAKVPFSWTLEPFAVGAEQTLVNAVSTSYPNIVDLTIPGELPTPLQITLTGATPWHCIYLGLLPAQTPALAALLLQAHDQTWAGGTCTAVVDANTYSASREQNASASLGAANVVDTTVPAGTYLMLARIAASAAGTVSFYLNELPVLQAVASGYLLTDAGVQRLPNKRVRSTGASQFLLQMAGNGTQNAWWDYVGLVPTTWGWALFHHAAGTTTTNLFLDYDGQWYDTHVAAPAYGRSGGLLGVGAQRLVVFADQNHGVGAGSVSITTTVKATPRWALWA